jgi:hypothetical protein
VSPGVLNARMRLVEGIGKASVFEEVSRDQPGLASPDDHDLKMIDHMARHNPWLLRPVVSRRAVLPHAPYSIHARAISVPTPLQETTPEAV